MSDSAQLAIQTAEDRSAIQTPVNGSRSRKQARIEATRARRRGHRTQRRKRHAMERNWQDCDEWD